MKNPIRKKTIAIDFDGVISKYSGWKGKGVFGRPIKGVAESLRRLRNNGCLIVINTTRLEVDEIQEFLEAHNIPFDYINHNPANVEKHLHPSKVLADVYIDDRALRFNGRWDDDFVKSVVGFKTWWRK